MIRINNKQVESKLLEILQSTTFSSVEEYLSSRIEADHKAVKMGKKIR